MSRSAAAERLQQSGGPHESVDAAVPGRVRFTEYSALRMLQRQVSAAEVFRVLTTAHRCYGQPNGRWRLDGEELTVVVELTDDAIVVTLFRGDEDGGEDEAD